MSRAMEDLFEYLDNGTGRGDDGDELILRGVEKARRISQGRRLARAHVSGDDGYGAQVDRIVEALFHPLEGSGMVEVLHLDVGRKRLVGEPEEVSHDSSFSNTLPPRYLSLSSMYSLSGTRSTASKALFTLALIFTLRGTSIPWEVPLYISSTLAGSLSW